MNDLGSNNVQIEGKTQQSDIFITVKTTGTHANKLNLLFATWIKQAKDEVRFLTIQLNKLSIYVFFITLMLKKMLTIAGVEIVLFCIIHSCPDR